MYFPGVIRDLVRTTERSAASQRSEGAGRVSRDPLGPSAEQVPQPAVVPDDVQPLDVGVDADDPARADGAEPEQQGRIDDVGVDDEPVFDREPGMRPPSRAAAQNSSIIAAPQNADQRTNAPRMLASPASVRPHITRWSTTGLPAIPLHRPVSGLPSGMAFVGYPAAVQLVSGLPSRYVTSLVSPPWKDPAHREPQGQDRVAEGVLGVFEVRLVPEDAVLEFAVLGRHDWVPRQVTVGRRPPSSGQQIPGR